MLKQIFLPSHDLIVAPFSHEGFSVNYVSLLFTFTPKKDAKTSQCTSGHILPWSTAQWMADCNRCHKVLEHYLSVRHLALHALYNIYYISILFNFELSKQPRPWLTVIGCDTFKNNKHTPICTSPQALMLYLLEKWVKNCHQASTKVSLPSEKSTECT